MSKGVLRIIGMGTVMALVVVSFAFLLTKSELDAERLVHAATAKERDEWKAAAEAYRQETEAQAENARLCLDREAQATRSAAERAVIMRKATPRLRTDTEKGQVVDDETRNRAADRLNRPL